MERGNKGGEIARVFSFALCGKSNSYISNYFGEDPKLNLKRR